MYTGSDSIAGVANKGFTATISSYTVLSCLVPWTSTQWPVSDPTVNLSHTLYPCPE